MSSTDHSHIPSEKTALLDQWIGDGSPTAHIEVDGQGLSIRRGAAMWLQVEAVGLGIPFQELIRRKFGREDRRN